MRIISGLAMATLVGIGLFSTQEAGAGVNVSRSLAIGACTKFGTSTWDSDWNGLFNTGTGSMTVHCASQQNFSDAQPEDVVNSVIAVVSDLTPGNISCDMKVVTYGGGIVFTTSGSTSSNGANQNLNFGAPGVSGSPFLSCSIPAASGGSRSGFHGFQVVQS